MKNSLCIGSALPNKGLAPKGTVPEMNERLLLYKRFSLAFSYPEKEDLRLEYDRLFRQGEVWLYGAEYSAENEFQRVQGLADINGFYQAFGLNTDTDRPDSLSCELEFMHYLIYKQLNAPDREKALISLSAQKKFFAVHLWPSAKKIAQAIIAKSKNNFYRELAQEMATFLECEEIFLKGKKQ